MIKTGKGGAGHAGGLFGKSDGKGAAAQLLAPGQKPTLTAGDPMSRMMGQFGKGHSYLQPGAGGADTGPATPTNAHPGISEIRGSGDAIKKNPRSGGLADAKEEMPSTSLSD